MKKILSLILASFLLSGCAAMNANSVKEAPVEESKLVVSYENRLPTVRSGNSDFTTYLMLSNYGYLDIGGEEVHGVVIEDMFYEHTVAWKAEPGTPLPNASQVKTSVNGATFRGWAYYDEDNDHVFPDYYENVPVKEGLALKAIFDGTSGGGGGGGGGGSDPATNVTFTITQFEDWVPNDGATVFVWSWGGGSGDGAWTQVTLSYFGENNQFTNVSGSFTAPNNITGFNIARCSAGTTLPNWNATGNSAGRVYNKTADVMVSSGVTSYKAPQFVEYNP